MKQQTAFLVMALVAPISFANVNVEKTALDKVIFQTSAKLWVTTETALVNVTINATLTNADLVKVRNDIMANLAKIATGNWHLTQFDRSQDSSGLEKLFVNAELRLPQAALTDLYTQAKTVSKPGTSYAIAGIDFTPSLEEITAIKAKVRENLYQQINAELGTLNKAYPQQNYSLNRVFIFDTNAAPQPLPMQAKQMKTAMMAAVSSAPNLAVSHELILTAVVELASNRIGSNAVVDK